MGKKAKGKIGKKRKNKGRIEKKQERRVRKGKREGKVEKTEAGRNKRYNDR